MFIRIWILAVAWLFQFLFVVFLEENESSKASKRYHHCIILLFFEFCLLDRIPYTFELLRKTVRTVTLLYCTLTIQNYFGAGSSKF